MKKTIILILIGFIFLIPFVLGDIICTNPVQLLCNWGADCFENCYNISVKCGNSYAHYFTENDSCWLNRGIKLKSNINSKINWNEQNVSIIINVTSSTAGLFSIDTESTDDIYIDFRNTSFNTSRSNVYFDFQPQLFGYNLFFNWNNGNVGRCGYGLVSNRYCLYFWADSQTFFNINNVTFYDGNFAIENQLQRGNITNCYFRNFSRGIDFTGGNNNNIINNSFVNMLGASIYTNDYTYTTSPPTYDGCDNLLIQGNIINQVGQSRANAIVIGDTFGINKTLKDNKVSNLQFNTVNRISTAYTLSGDVRIISNNNCSTIGGTGTGDSGICISGIGLNDSKIDLIDCDRIGNVAGGGTQSYCIYLDSGSNRNNISNLWDFQNSASGTDSGFAILGNYNLIDLNYSECMVNDFCMLVQGDYNVFQNFNLGIFRVGDTAIWLSGGDNNTFKNISCVLDTDRAYSCINSESSNNTLIIDSNMTCEGSYCGNTGLCSEDYGYDLAFDFWSLDIRNGKFETKLINTNLSNYCFNHYGGDRDTLIRNWYLNYNVSDLQGNFIDTADTKIYNNSNVLLYDFIGQQSNGVLNFTSYLQDENFTYYYSNYSINVTAQFYNPLNIFFNLSNNLFWDINLSIIPRPKGKYFYKLIDEESGFV